MPCNAMAHFNKFSKMGNIGPRITPIIVTEIAVAVKAKLSIGNFMSNTK